MEHTEKYLQAKWLTENPKGYDDRDVIGAKRYCNAYLEGYNQALSIADVSQQRELLNALADKFNESTHTYVGQPMIEETLKAFNCC